MPAPDRSLTDVLERWRRRELESRRPIVDASERPGAARGTAPDDTGIELLPYGITDERPEPVCTLVATLGSVESEYAAIRRGAGVLACPHRATITLRGADRGDFLDRLLTAPLSKLAPGDVRPAFMLNRKGRILADILVVHLEDRTLLDLDVLQASDVVAALEAAIFVEDVAVTDDTEDIARLAVHGPSALDVLPAVLEDRHADAMVIAETPVVAARRDQVGAPGIELFVPLSAVEPVWDALVAATVRPVGWYAFNIARIEAGTPLFNVDFGGTNLPHETGVLHDRVSFRKGCYPGQEIVARIESQGSPKQTLVGLRIDADALPVAGAQVFDAAEGGLGDPIGVVTSSTLSPMLGATAVAFAMVRTKFADASALRVIADGEPVDGRLGPLRFWPAVPAREQTT